MNEKDMILRAMAKPSPVKVPCKVQKKLFPSAFENKDDPLYKLVEPKPVKKKKKKYISEWIASDFIRHLEQNLLLYGIVLETSNLNPNKTGIRDSSWMNELYDKLVNKLQHDMNNHVLREYIDWWCGSFARFKTGQHLYVSSISSDNDICNFVEIKQHKHVLKSVEEVVIADESISSMDVYKKFGINRLLIEKGIVDSYRVMSEVGQSAVFSQISSALSTFSKSIFERVMSITMSKTYNTKDTVDFISISRRTIKFHGLDKKYGKIDYKEFFNGDSSSEESIIV